MSALYIILVVLLLATAVTMQNPPICNKYERIEFCTKGEATCEQRVPRGGKPCWNKVLACHCRPNLYRRNGKCVPASKC
uniref:TIL domain-containing protein n=1 Tax=Panagrellus redivivus TaxID=6233 RepID=A0A7E4UUT0_PANRE